MTNVSGLPFLAQTAVSGWIVFLVVLAVFVLPFVVGSFLGRVLRVKDLAFKIGVVLFTAVLGVAPFVWQSVVGAMERRDYQAELADWQSRQISEAEQEPFDKAIEDLRKAKPDLRIER